jgi:hypothetical protein
LGRNTLVLDRVCVERAEEAPGLPGAVFEDRCTELSELIGWYRRSCPRALTNQPRADEIAEDSLF